MMMQDLLDREPLTGSRGDSGYGIVSRALMGAAAGAAGTWALGQSDWIMWRKEDEKARLRTNAVRPGGEPPAHVLSSKVEQLFDLNLTAEQHEIAGVAIHYGIGIAPAVGYALVRDSLPGKGPVRGLLFGLGLFLMQDEVVNSASGLGARPRQYPWQAHARGLVAHLVYGVATEMLLGLMDRNVRAARPGSNSDGEAQGRPRAIRAA